MSKRQKKGKEQAGRKRRVTPRQTMTAWIIVVFAGTGAWYALAAMPDGKSIQQMQADLRRAESRLEENRVRVAELDDEITTLQTQADTLDDEYAAFDAYVGTLTAAAEYGETLAASLAEVGLEVTQVQAPRGWDATVDPYRTATFTLDATGTYDAITAALDTLEAQAGVSVRELQIVKSGGDPNDPTLIARLTIQAHVTSHQER